MDCKQTFALIDVFVNLELLTLSQHIVGYSRSATCNMAYKSWDSSKVCKLMELDYFYKVEMPNLKNLG